MEKHSDYVRELAAETFNNLVEAIPLLGGLLLRAAPAFAGRAVAATAARAAAKKGATSIAANAAGRAAAKAGGTKVSFGGLKDTIGRYAKVGLAKDPATYKSTGLSSTGSGASGARGSWRRLAKKVGGEIAVQAAVERGVGSVNRKWRERQAGY